MGAGLVAAQSDLGHRWWWPLVGLGFSSIACIVTFSVGTRLKEGPDPAEFYSTYGGLPAAEANAILLRLLDDALSTAPVRSKVYAWSIAFGLLLLSGAFAAVVFGFGV